MIRWHDDSSTPCLPMVASPESQAVVYEDLLAWTRANSDEVLARLHLNGAILFRGFPFCSPEQFQEFANVFCPVFGDYVGGNTPRTKVGGHVFTATEYPNDERISMHNEASYLKSMPGIVLFYCAQPAASGGQTPLADSRRVLNRIDPSVRREFEKHGVRYVNNMHGGYGLGRSWQKIFGTDQRPEVERRLEQDHYSYEWKADGGLRTSIEAPATTTHPRTLESAWINQAEQWHPSSLNPETREALLEIMSEKDLPHNACLGDGSPLDLKDLQNIRAAMIAEKRMFDWQRGDVLLCDNVLVMHGREPFSGDRRVLVALG